MQFFIPHPSSLILVLFILFPFGELRAGASSLILAAPYASVERDYEIRFPGDEGSHPQFRTEWWYVTGWLERTSGKPLGFQVTFFRTRPFEDSDNPSAFAPRQIIFAHAAIADERQSKLVHEQKSARAGFGLAGAKEGAMNVWLGDWFFRSENESYTASVRAQEFALDLRFAASQAPLLQGENGFSRKGKDSESASHYYSLPQLAVSGTVTLQGKAESVSGKAWLDHEWSSRLLEEGAVGWDWIGINFADGGALMAFQIRNAEGAEHWAGATYRSPRGETQAFDPAQIQFTPLQSWRSPRTGTTYPVQWKVRAGNVEVTLVPMMADQELDSRGTTGALYWEGAVRAFTGDVVIGKGYLELTGYGQPLRLD